MLYIPAMTPVRFRYENAPADKLTDENGKKLTEEDMTDGDVYLIYGDSIMLESFPGQYPGITKMVRKEQGNQEKADQYRQARYIHHRTRLRYLRYII